MPPQPQLLHRNVLRLLIKTWVEFRSEDPLVKIVLQMTQACNRIIETLRLLPT
jgi:hypothetical protein